MPALGFHAIEAETSAVHRAFLVAAMTVAVVPPLVNLALIPSFGWSAFHVFVPARGAIGLFGIVAAGLVMDSKRPRTTRVAKVVLILCVAQLISVLVLFVVRFGLLSSCE